MPGRDPRWADHTVRTDLDGKWDASEVTWVDALESNGAPLSGNENRDLDIDGLAARHAEMNRKIGL